MAEKGTSHDEEPEDPVSAALDDLNTRLTYLEAFSIASFILMKEDMRERGKCDACFGGKFQQVFREAMAFLEGDGDEGPGGSPHATPMAKAREYLATLMRNVEQGK